MAAGDPTQFTIEPFLKGRQLGQDIALQRRTQEVLGQQQASREEQLQGLAQANFEAGRPQVGLQFIQAAENRRARKQQAESALFNQVQTSLESAFEFGGAAAANRLLADFKTNERILADPMLSQFLPSIESIVDEEGQFTTNSRTDLTEESAESLISNFQLSGNEALSVRNLVGQSVNIKTQGDDLIEVTQVAPVELLKEQKLDADIIAKALEAKIKRKELAAVKAAGFTDDQQKTIFKRLDETRKDAAFKIAGAQLLAATNAKLLLEQRNPAADRTIGTVLAKLSGEVGVLTDKDIQRFGGSQALDRLISRSIEKASTGLIQEVDRQDLADLVNAFISGSQKNIRGITKSQRKIASKVSGISQDRLTPLFDDLIESFIATEPVDLDTGEPLNLGEAQIAEELIPAETIERSDGRFIVLRNAEGEAIRLRPFEQ